MIVEKCAKNTRMAENSDEIESVNAPSSSPAKKLNSDGCSCIKIEKCRECNVRRISEAIWVSDGPKASPFHEKTFAEGWISSGMEDETGDARIDLEPFRISTRGQYTYGLDEFEKNAMIIFAQSDERGQHVKERIDMLTSRFGDYRFEAEVHVDSSAEEMESTLKQFFSRDFSCVGAVVLVALAQAGEAGLLPTRTQRYHESVLLRHLTSDQPDQLRGKPKIYITEANRTGVTADTGFYSLPLNKYSEFDVLGIHIPVVIDGESHPLKILCEQLGNEVNFLDDVYSAVQRAETTFPELKDRPVQVIDTLQMQLRLERKTD